MRLNHDHSQSSSDSLAQRVQRSRYSMSLNAKSLLAATIVGFGVLHLVGDTILQHASGRPPIEDAMPAHNGD
jgi:hypothetical protein